MSDDPSSGPLRVTVRDHGALQDLADERRLFAVVDTVGDYVTYAHLRTLGERACCLYYGAEGARFAGIAPWLVQVDRAVSDWINDELRARSPAWGVYAVSRAAPAAVARQLRRWLTVRNPGGELVRFRFYDPRVLSDFVEASTADELRAFFGSAIEAFAHHDDATDEVRLYTQGYNHVALPTRRVRLGTASVGPPRADAPPPPRGIDAPFPLGLTVEDR